MNINDIINYLKENIENGVSYFFMPEPVKDWVDKDIKDFKKSELFIFTKFGNWVKIRDEDGIDLCDFDNFVFALPKDFELRKELEGKWVEFKIRQDGYFNSDTGLYLWCDWQKFLKFSYNHDIGFTAFGGWLYDKSGGGDWVLSPQVGLIDDSGNAPFILNRYSHTYEKERITPAIPIKIRFWKGLIKK